MAQDLYAVLGVAKDADDDAIKKAFRKLAMKYHPDKSPGKANEQRFKEINQAHEVLADKKKRSLYDEFGEESLSQNFDAERARVIRQYGGRSAAGGRASGPNGGVDMQDIFGGAAGGDPSDIFGEIFNRRGRGQRRGPMRGQDAETSVTIDFVSAVRGTELQLQRGGETVIVRVPPGANEGSRLRIAGQGGEGMGGGPAGDLLVTVHVKPHPFFTRDGDDLHVEVPVTLAEAYRGEKIRVPTPDGDVTLKVPKRTQTGSVTRLRAKGVARKGKEPGDLYVKFSVRVPTLDDPEVAKAIDVLAATMTEDPREGLVF